jgi:hypothetical protein
VNVLALELFDLFWSMLWFFLFLMWVYLFIALISDVFRSHDLSGWGKALWVTALLVFPVLGSLAYVVARGDGIAERQVEMARRQDAAFRGYVQEAAGTATPADEVAKLVDLHASGALDDEEFERQKARALA